MKRTRPVRFWKLWQKPPIDSAELLHFWYDRVLWEKRPSLKRRLKLIWTTLAWPIDSAVLLRKLVKEYGQSVYKGTGISPKQQFFGAWWMALRDFRVPIGYYKTRLYMPELKRNAWRFLDTDEIRLLLTK